MLRRLPLLVALFLGLAAPAYAKPLKVVTSFSILGDMVGEVGGNDVEITTIVGPEGDAHVFEPTPAHAKAVAEADLVFANGLGLEPWLDRLVKSSGYKGKVVLASEGVKALKMEAEEEPGHEADSHKHGTVSDPHAWQDLANGRRYVSNIAKALADAAPDRAAAFQASAEAYSKRLAELDSWVRGEIDSVPKSKRKMLTTHDAFGYFGKAYGIALLAPQGISTEAEPTAKDLAKLARQMKTEKVKAIFLENMSNPRLIEQLAKDAGATVGGTLYADALSAKDGPAPTYEAMFHHNIPLIRDAMAKN